MTFLCSEFIEKLSESSSFLSVTSKVRYVFKRYVFKRYVFKRNVFKRNVFKRNVFKRYVFKRNVFKRPKTLSKLRNLETKRLEMYTMIFQEHEFHSRNSPERNTVVRTPVTLWEGEGEGGSNNKSFTFTIRAPLACSSSL